MPQTHLPRWSVPKVRQGQRHRGGRKARKIRRLARLIAGDLGTVREIAKAPIGQWVRAEMLCGTVAIPVDFELPKAYLRSAS